MNLESRLELIETHIKQLTQEIIHLKNALEAPAVPVSINGGVIIQDEHGLSLQNIFTIDATHVREFGGGNAIQFRKIPNGKIEVSIYHKYHAMYAEMLPSDFVNLFGGMNVSTDG